uniref:Uncharacterized protein n=1 Tax=uncultured marine virus TaxID=186617 RepID=A0A0F7L5W1_9VIRU|nr:hypothetical protein [uncultured marine virus]
MKLLGLSTDSAGRLGIGSCHQGKETSALTAGYTAMQLCACSMFVGIPSLISPSLNRLDHAESKALWGVGSVNVLHPLCARRC